MSSGGNDATGTTGVDADHDPEAARRSVTTTTSTPSSSRVKLTAVSAYDPEGDDHENDDLAPLAVDGDSVNVLEDRALPLGSERRASGWCSTRGKARPLARVLVSTDAAGASAEIEVGMTTRTARSTSSPP